MHYRVLFVINVLLVIGFCCCFDAQALSDTVSVDVLNAFVSEIDEIDDDVLNAFKSLDTGDDMHLGIVQKCRLAGLLIGEKISTHFSEHKHEYLVCLSAAVAGYVAAYLLDKYCSKHAVV